VCAFSISFKNPSQKHRIFSVSVTLSPEDTVFFQFFMFGNGALPHRPTKGLSERLRRPFGASPFGNLRAQILRFTLEISVL